MLPKNDGDAHDDDDDLRKKAKVVQLLLHIPHTAPASGQYTDDHHTTTPMIIITDRPSQVLT